MRDYPCAPAARTEICLGEWFSMFPSERLVIIPASLSLSLSLPYHPPPHVDCASRTQNSRSGPKVGRAYVTRSSSPYHFPPSFLMRTGHGENQGSWRIHEEIAHGTTAAGVKYRGPPPQLHLCEEVEQRACRGGSRSAVHGWTAEVTHSSHGNLPGSVSWLHDGAPAGSVAERGLCMQ